MEPPKTKRIISVKFEARELKNIRHGLEELQRGVPFDQLSVEIRHAIHHFLVTTLCQRKSSRCDSPTLAVTFPHGM